MAYGQLHKTPLEDLKAKYEVLQTKNSRLVADERLHKVQKSSYFVDFDAYPQTLLMMTRDGSNELLERIDDRFNFHEKQIAQIGSKLFTYAWGDPVKVTRITDPAQSYKMKVSNFPSLHCGL